MAVVLGFVLALAISLTGVGAGSMTTPLLILLLRVPPAVAVGTALTFGAIVKLIAVPTYIVRRQINLRILGLMLAGGIPGVLGGSVVLSSFKGGGYESWLYATLGILIASTALFTLYRTLRPRKNQTQRDRSSILPWLALPIGAEVGFSSAGSGALGSLLLLGLTKLSAAEVVGTDLAFGLTLAMVGSAFHLGAGNYDGALLFNLALGGV
ncbi:MAG TPA: sulfite exporter TauE/SafE family protein, partial [Acidobacteriaceae bacterium]